MIEPASIHRAFAPTLLFCLLAVLVSPAQAQWTRSQHVAAQLVAEVEAIAPGTEFEVGVRLRHDEHWHTYWKHTATGYATSLEWKLPPGFTAGPIQWPTPRLYEMAGYFEYVYEADVLLPGRISAPADLEPGTRLDIAVTASWLMCADVCIPGSVDLSLTLPVAEQTRPNPQTQPLFAEARRQLPLESDAFSVSAGQHEDRVWIRIAPAESDVSVPANLYFFDDQGYIEPTASQEQRRLEDGSVVLLMTDDPAGISEIDALSGVIKTLDGSWSADEERPGLAFSTPLRSGPPPLILHAEGVSGTAADETGLALILLLALVGGLILNLMPCVFPVIGIKIMGFVGKAGEVRKKVAMHGLMFTAGVLVSFWILAAVLILLRSGGQQLGWGFQLQSPVFVYVLALFFFLFGLNMAGLFEVGQSTMGLGNELTGRSGFSGSFFSGVLATVVATPCAAPFLAPALGAALALPAFVSLVVFTAIGIGLALPYLVLSIFPGLIGYLPKPGAWMETFKQLMSFLLFATAGYLVWVLMGQLTESQGYLDTAMRQVLFAVVLVAIGGWAYGRWGASHRKRKVRLAGYAAAVVLILGGFIYGYPNPALAGDADAPAVTWQKWEPGKAEDLARSGKRVYVDFTARWCVTCQTNKAAVFSSAEVRELFAQEDVVALKADWTNTDPQITQALESFGRSAVPFNLVYLPESPTSPEPLPELLTPGIVLKALRK